MLEANKYRIKRRIGKANSNQLKVEIRKYEWMAMIQRKK